MSRCSLRGGFWQQEQFFPAQQIQQRALQLQRQQRWQQAPINDCADRADFATVLLAAAAAEHACLLPNSSAQEALTPIQDQYPGAQWIRTVPALQDADTAACPESLQCRAEEIATVGFTSGSTGHPKAVSKSWHTQIGVVTRVAEQARHWDMSDAKVVATVPPQHTFGLEMSVLMALLGGWQVASSRPFYPADIAAVLVALPGPRLLVTTPVHLRTLLADPSGFPEMGMILSATAPLDPTLAQAAEKRFNCPVREIYGSTETGAIASRRTVDGDRWTLLPRVRFVDPETAAVDADHLPTGCCLPDRLAVHDEYQFTLLGRPEGMLKVGGKRSSLAAVQHAMLAIPGIADAEVFLLDGRERPVALLVAPNLAPGELRRELARTLDPVFIPRPMRQIDHIPRTGTGKAQRAELLECWEQAAPFKATR